MNFDFPFKDEECYEKMRYCLHKIISSSFSSSLVVLDNSPISFMIRCAESSYSIDNSASSITSIDFLYSTQGTIHNLNLFLVWYLIFKEVIPLTKKSWFLPKLLPSVSFISF
ncbi:hypothetical protein CLV81_0302 [Flagellimonas meridianipacifica]|uniref:Uncharacterized protein n=1 Tax=Flagellimonas meridianipacifica TaxID=1080225 RepID=A0A2T0MFE7_9FLAO|nr:hypothetical protein CLV81_0302 [Allomuricauda pacifica]